MVATSYGEESKQRLRSDDFTSASLDAAAIITRTQYSNHAGIIYKRSKGTTHFLHLRTEDALDTAWEWQFLWAPLPLPPEKLFSVGLWCHRIYTKYVKTRKFPYGMHINLEDQPAFVEGGGLHLGKDTTGLTCATLIVAILNSLGVRLFVESGWPPRQEEDLAWASRLPPSLRQMVEDQLRQGNVLRIRAEEVLGACLCMPPVDFDACRAASLEVLKSLESIDIAANS